MTHIKAIARLQMDSGIPEDAVVNTWHADCTLLADGQDEFADALATFYEDIKSLLSANVALTGHSLTLYNMLDPEPRAPILTQAFTFSATGSQAMVPELAVCLSFQGERESGVSQARRRGRVYIGPLGNSVTSTTDPTVATSVINGIKAAGDQLLTTSNGSVNWTWCVYSQADDALVDVTNGWVDNAFDIQRRRGLTATVRSTFP